MKNTIVDTCLLPPQSEREDGFTLIEILVVIIIIGILAAVAIPIFLNQQAAARDSATTQDARNLASNLYTLTSSDPDIKQATLSGGHDDPDDTEYTITSDGGSTLEVTKTEGTIFSSGGTSGDVISYTPAGGEFTFEAWNENGREYLSASPLVWANGELENASEGEDPSSGGGEALSAENGSAHPLVFAYLKAQLDLGLEQSTPERQIFKSMSARDGGLSESDQAAFDITQDRVDNLNSAFLGAQNTLSASSEAYDSLVEVAERDSDPEIQQLATDFNLAANAYLAESRKITADNEFENPEKVQSLWVAYQNAGVAHLNQRVA